MEEIKRELELATLPEMPKRLDYRIGVIGAGFIVRNCHLEAYRKAGFNPVAITSLDQEQSKEVAALHKIQTVYPTWKELVDDKSIEIIEGAVPPHVQTGFHYVGQADLELLTSSDPPACSRSCKRYFVPETDCDVPGRSKTDCFAGRRSWNSDRCEFQYAL